MHFTIERLHDEEYGDCGVAYAGYKIGDALADTVFKTTDVYAPDRLLPMTEDGIPIPDTDAPHTQLSTQNGSKEKYAKAREFDKNGKPIREIDFTDHGYPKNHTNPHQHRREPNPNGGTPSREDAEPVPEWRYE